LHEEVKRSLFKIFLKKGIKIPEPKEMGVYK